MKSRFAKFCRKSLAIALGLFLGWMAADVAFDQLATTAYGATAAPGVPVDQHDEVAHAMEALTHVGGAPWYGKMVLAVVMLFIAAAVLGPIAQSLKSPEPPERDEHDAHGDGHDAHGHDAGHGHAAH